MLRNPLQGQLRKGESLPPASIYYPRATRLLHDASRRTQTRPIFPNGYLAPLPLVDEN